MPYKRRKGKQIKTTKVNELNKKKLSLDELKQNLSSSDKGDDKSISDEDVVKENSTEENTEEAVNKNTENTASTSSQEQVNEIPPKKSSTKKTNTNNTKKKSTTKKSKKSSKQKEIPKEEPLVEKTPVSEIENTSKEPVKEEHNFVHYLKNSKKQSNITIDPHLHYYNDYFSATSYSFVILYKNQKVYDSDVHDYNIHFKKDIVKIKNKNYPYHGLIILNKN